MLLQPILIFLSGAILGAAITWLIMRQWLKSARGSFAEMSLDILEKVSSSLQRENQSLISQERAHSAEALGKVGQAVTEIEQTVRMLERDREQKFGELSHALKITHRDSQALATLTRELHSVIYQKQARGYWGERMAEDILRLAGFQEGVNYERQKVLSNGNRPDFTFFLPKDLIMNMDVKFPLENFSRYMNTEDSKEAEIHLKAFINDLKVHIKAVEKRGYTSSADNTVDYTVIFIPSDLIYTTIFQAEPYLIDYALGRAVILASPATLFAVLAVVRQAIDNFALENSTDEIINLMEVFLKEWQAYAEKTETVAKRFDALQKDFTELTGQRSQKLEAPLAKFRALIRR